MNGASGYLYKIASEAWEFEQIHRLNYRTFVEEIPQHAPNPEERLIDRFHEENTYIISLLDKRLMGMLAVRGKRPFSLDAKLPDLDTYLPDWQNPCEVRLLAVEPDARKTTVFPELFERVVRYCLTAGYDICLISGAARQLKLYKHMGFIPFGPMVGSEQAPYQPMYLALENFRKTLEDTAGRSSFARSRFVEKAAPEQHVYNFLPGPVSTTPEVRKALAEAAISHRGQLFLERMTDLRARLRRLTNACDVQLMPGSGTLANAVVAAQLSLKGTTGLIISNGEFGERLAGNAHSAGLRFEWLRLPWGEVFDMEEVERLVKRLAGNGNGGWIWFAHHETSTGVMNPLAALKELAARFNLHVCVDAISSIGAMPVDLSDVYLATCASGKGLGGFSGIGMVFHQDQPAAAPDRLPGYLDLGHWRAHRSVPHTQPSNLIAALDVAVSQATTTRMQQIDDNARWLRQQLCASGFRLVAPEAAASPGIVTIVSPQNTRTRGRAADSTSSTARRSRQSIGMFGDCCILPERSAAALGEELGMRGFWLNYRSQYLLERDWIQVSLLGNPSRKALEKLVNVLSPV
ncbi:MAG: aminotransferase class V-fold PLP-dependent enzyme [Betaproteobacteria bacterium]|nr:aminotransferase class V-fold PLP-dependent enzyme [Betaproteobacteria bacterium]